MSLTKRGVYSQLYANMLLELQAITHGSGAMRRTARTSGVIIVELTVIIVMGPAWRRLVALIPMTIRTKSLRAS